MQQVASEEENYQKNFLQTRSIYGKEILSWIVPLERRYR